MMSWCERHEVGYIIGHAKNSRLNRMSADLHELAEKNFTQSGKKQRLFCSIRYGASTWDKKRRVIVKAEHSRRGGNPRYVVTNLAGDDQDLYDNLYCARGDMENRIKEQQLCLFSGRTSCHEWYANQFRILLSSLAYVLIESLRRLLLTGTELANAQASTIRLRLIKIGTVVTRNTRSIKLMLSSTYPWQELFAQTVRQLC
jgi:hypothetical protein